MNQDQQLHTVSIAAITLPGIAFWVNINPILTGCLAVAGLCWYAILFSEKVSRWVAKYRRNHKE